MAYVTNMWTSALSDLLLAFRSRPLDVPLDLGLLGFGDTLQECGVALDPKQKSLLYRTLHRT